MTRPFNYVAWADRVNAQAACVGSTMPKAYPTLAAVATEQAREREVRASLAAPCDAPRCAYCGVLTTDPHCLEAEP